MTRKWISGWIWWLNYETIVLMELVKTGSCSREERILTSRSHYTWNRTCAHLAYFPETKFFLPPCHNVQGNGSSSGGSPDMECCSRTRWTFDRHLLFSIAQHISCKVYLEIILWPSSLSRNSLFLFSFPCKIFGYNIVLIENDNNNRTVDDQYPSLGDSSPPQ